PDGQTRWTPPPPWSSGSLATTLGASPGSVARLDSWIEVSNHSFHGNDTDRRPARGRPASPCPAAPRTGTGPAGGLPGLAAVRRPADMVGRSPGALVALPLGIASGRRNRRHCPDPGPAGRLGGGRLLCLRLPRPRRGVPPRPPPAAHAGPA